MPIEIRLYATLRQFSPSGANAGVFSWSLSEGSTVRTLVDSLGINADKVHMRMVNGVSVTDAHVLKDNDRVGLFPPVGGG